MLMCVGLICSAGGAWLITDMRRGETIFEIDPLLQVSCACLGTMVFGWLCFTSPRQRGHLETAPSFTVPCKGREARFLPQSYRESNPGLSRGHPLHCCYATQAPYMVFDRYVLYVEIYKQFSLIH